MEILGMDLTDDSMCESPARVAKMYVNELMWGLDPNNFPKWLSEAMHPSGSSQSEQISDSNALFAQSNFLSTLISSGIQIPLV